jgi:hypothetical protein
MVPKSLAALSTSIIPAVDSFTAVARHPARVGHTMWALRLRGQAER